jgi:hypothetical protein
MAQREPLMNEAFFREEMAYVESMIAKRSKDLRERAQALKKPGLYLRANAREQLQLLLLAYSAGDPVAEIRPRLVPAIDALEAYLSWPGTPAMDLANFDDYLTALWLLSFALAFKLEDAQFKRLLALLGNGGRDALFDRLVAHRVPGGPLAGQLLHPAIFAPLLAVLDTALAQRAMALARYMAGWYKSMADAYWHESHKGPDGGGFFGYWAVEAVGACAVAPPDGVAALGKLPHFPAELLG